MIDEFRTNWWYRNEPSRPLIHEVELAMSDPTFPKHTAIEFRFVLPFCQIFPKEDQPTIVTVETSPLGTWAQPNAFRLPLEHIRSRRADTPLSIDELESWIVAETPAGDDQVRCWRGRGTARPMMQVRFHVTRFLCFAYPYPVVPDGCVDPAYWYHFTLAESVETVAIPEYHVTRGIMALRLVP